MQFHDAYAGFKSRNAELVVISGDSVFSHFAWQEVPRNKGGIGVLECPHVSDYAHTLTKALGIYNETDSSADNNGTCYRGLYVVNPEGIISHITVNDYAIGRDVDECFRVIDAIEHVKKTGNVCQAGWKKGDKGVSASNEGIKKFIIDTSKK